MRVLALLSSAVVLLLPAAAAAQTSPLYRNTEHRFAVIFPGEPMARDITFSARGGASVPARQFYVEQGTDRYLVTVVHFPTGPAVDDQIVEHAAEQLRQRGEVRFQAAAPYDPGMPGRQLNVFESNGRQLRASVYMADRRLTITEASAAVGDFPALQFEQSITLIDANGDDLDRPNNNQEPRNFGCRR